MKDVRDREDDRGDRERDERREREREAEPAGEVRKGKITVPIYDIDFN
jgi:hypothetical protein